MSGTSWPLRKGNNMTNTTLLVPLWVTNVIHFLERNWIAMVGILIIALLSSVIGWAAKHHFSTKYEEDSVKKIVNWVLVAVSAGFTVLGTLIYFVQTNQMALKKIPYIGTDEITVLGVMWTMYQLRLKTTFQNWEAKLAKWSGSKLKPVSTPADTLVSPTVATPPPAEFTL